MRIYYSLLVILTISFLFSIPILSSNSPNISKSFVKAYFSQHNLPLRISAVICTAPLYWDLFRSAINHKLRAFHVGTSLFALTSLFEILIWSTPHSCFGFFFTFREVIFLIGLFSLIFHHRNAINLHTSNIICLAFWSFGFVSGLLTYSYQSSTSLLIVPIVPISLAMIIAVYDYLRFFCDSRPEQSFLKTPPSIISPKVIHSDYSLLNFLFSIVLASSQIYFFLALYIPTTTYSFTHSTQSSGVDDDHITGPALQYHGTISLVIISFSNIYPYLMAYRDMEVALLEQREFYRNLGHEIRTPLNTSLMGLQLIREVIYTTSTQPSRFTSHTKLPDVSPEGRHSIHKDLVQEYSRLKSESLVLLNSRAKYPSEGSSRSFRDQMQLTSVHSDHDSQREPCIQHSPLHTTRPEFTFQTSDSTARDCVSEIKPYVDDVLGSCETAIDVLNEMLLFETLRAGEMSHEFKPYPLLKIVLDPLSHFRIQAKSKHLDFILPDMAHFQGEVLSQMSQLRVIVDINKFSKVLRNLVSNAIKFTQANGKVSVSVYVTKVATLPSEWQTEERVWKYAKARSSMAHVIAEFGLHLYGYARISVTDTGVGLSAEDQARLFQEIIQINPNKNQGGQGSGLGLYISAEIVRVHNGYYTVTSPGEGFGSTFSVFLPLYLAPECLISSNEYANSQVDARDLEVGVSLPPSRRNTPPPEDSLKGRDIEPLTSGIRRNSVIHPILPQEDMYCNPSTVLTSGHSRVHVGTLDWRVLVVDDAPSNRKIMSRFLKIRGLRVDEADCGKTAIQMCKKSLSHDITSPDTNCHVEDASSSTPYDVIFLDHDMPDLTGPETAQVLREIGYQRHLIGLTGHVDGEHHNRFLDCGVSRVLVKPVSLHVLDELFEVLNTTKT